MAASRGRSSALLFLAVVCAGTAAAQSAIEEESIGRRQFEIEPRVRREVGAYLQVVQLYAQGERSNAAAEIARWSGVYLSDQIGPFMQLGPTRKWDPGGRLVRAALMLHTDAAEVDRANFRAPALQDMAARSLARQYAHDPALRDFARRWYLAVASAAAARTECVEALAWARLGLQEFDDDVELRLLVASVEEVLASSTAPPWPDAVFEGPAAGTKTRPTPLGGQSREHLERALRALQEAAKLQPQRIDVRLRRGRVEWRLGRFAEAHRTLEALLTAARGEQAYLGRLFYGQLLESEGRLEDAAREYSLAVALDPQCQAARLALSHVGFVLGETEEARSDVQRALAPAGRRARADAFWQYPWGLSTGSQALLTALRSEASR